MKNKIRPLFIFSQPRSGSTLLQKLLMTHKTIFSVNEPWVLLPFVGAVRENGTLSDYSHLTSYKAIQDFMHSMGGEEVLYNNLHDFIINLYDAAARYNKSDAAYFLDKTPRYYLIIPQIARLFPEARFIFLFRNPLAIFSSVVKTWHNDRLMFHFNYIDLFEAPQYLTEGYRLLKDQSIKINYEKLVTDTNRELHRISGFLGIDVDEFELARFKDLELKGMMGDAEGAKKYSNVSSESLYKWKQGCNSFYRKRVIKKYLRSLGEDYLNLTENSRGDLIAEIDKVKVNKIGLKDFLDYAAANLYRRLRLIFQRRRFSHLFGDGEKIKCPYY